MRHAPVASKFSSARPSGSITRWHDGACRVAAVLLHALAHGQQLARRVALVSSSAGTFGGGGGGGDPSSTSITHLPRMHRRRPIGDRRQRQDAALPEQPAAVRRAARRAGTRLPVTFGMP